MQYDWGGRYLQFAGWSSKGHALVNINIMTFELKNILFTILFVMVAIIFIFIFI